MKKSSFWTKPISRKEFIKKGVLAAAGLGISGYLLKEYLDSSQSLGLGDAPAPKLWKWSKEAYHYEQLGLNVQCHVCPNQCMLEENARSICRNKTNIKGKMYTLAYGNPCAVHLDPIEKKPLFHFLPGSKAFSIATAGCNFRCLNCQNWEISQQYPENTSNEELFPDSVVQNAKSTGSRSIAYTYSEPIAYYEYMYDTAKLARQSGIKNLWITNGHIREDALKDLAQFIDAANVNLKSFKESIYGTLNSGRLQPVLDTLKTLKSMGVWFEVTNLVVPGWTDDLDMIKEMSQWLYKNLGPDYPLHFSRFYPLYKLANLAQTPLSTLEKAKKIAVGEGLHFVYIGNTPEIDGENTLCFKCGKLLVERKGFSVLQNNIKDSSCKFCGQGIAGVWQA
ncbi:MAG: AmmeMemoRadiSam system radical SAM enzyme [Candidatus Woesearchaeota archaeon]